MKRLGELSEVVGGQLAAQHDLEITGAASIFRAGETEITFVTSRIHFENFLESDAAAAVIGFEPETQEKPCILVDDVTEAFIEIVELFKPQVDRPKLGISPQAIVSPSAKISDDVCATIDGNESSLINVVGLAVIFGHVEGVLAGTPVPTATSQDGICPPNSTSSIETEAL